MQTYVRDVFKLFCSSNCNILLCLLTLNPSEMLNGMSLNASSSKMALVNLKSVFNVSLFRDVKYRLVM